MSVDRAWLSRRALDVAPDLLGCVVVRTSAEGTVAVRLTEVEAYEGADDPGSHAYRGRTERNAVMFDTAGHLYVYFTYGMHWCANIVCGPDGVSSAVLMRAGEVVDGAPLARKRRPAARTDRDLARGPARLAAALGLDRSDNGVDLLDPDRDVRLQVSDGDHPVSQRPNGDSRAPDAERWLHGPGSDRPSASEVREQANAGRGPSGSIRTGPRVGLANGATRPWRFWLDGEPTVSQYRPHKRRR